MAIGSNIATLRAARGFTQAQLSERVNIHPITLSNWERGKREPSSSDIERLAQALSCTPGDLFEGNPQVSPEAPKESAS